MIQDDKLVQAVSRAQGGSQDAFGLLVRRFYRPVCGVVYGQVGDWDAAEELAQETFLTAWQHRNALRNPDKFPAWLLQIARNLAKNWIRSAVYRRELAQRYGQTSEHQYNPSTPQEEASVMNDRKDALSRALDQLSPNLREAVLLFYMEQKSVEETALSLGISVNAAKKRTQRGRDALRAILESEWERDLEERARSIRSEDSVTKVMGMLALPPASAGLSQAAATEAASALGGGTVLAGIGGLKIAAIIAVAIAATALFAADPIRVWSGEGGTGEETAVPSENETDTVQRGETGSANTQLSVASLGGEQNVSSGGGANDDSGTESESAAVPSEDDGSPTNESDSGDNEAESTEPARLSGEVVTSFGDPVEGARVILYESDFWTVYDPESDAALSTAAPRVVFSANNGAFAFQNVVAGTYKLAATADGYEDRKPWSISLSAGEQQTDQDIRLDTLSGVEFFGRVVDDSGRPVTNAVVECKGLIRDGGGLISGTLSAGVTDSDGIFGVEVPDEGRATFAVRSATLGVALFRNVPTDMEQPVKLTWPDSATLKGTITGPGAAGGLVRLNGEVTIEMVDDEGNVRGWGNSSGANFSGTIGPDGAYEINGIAIGSRYSVSIRNAENESVMPELPLDPFAPGERRTFNHALEEETLIAGVVRGAVSRQPLRDVRVIWYDAGNPEVRDEQFVDDNGSFEFDVHLEAGRYVVTPTFRTSGAEDYAQTYGQVIDLVPGEDVTIELELLDPVTRTVQAVDVDGNPVEGASISYREHHGGGTSSWGWGMETDENGYATYAGAAPNVEVSFEVSDYTSGASGETAQFAGQPGDVFDPEMVVLE